MGMPFWIFLSLFFWQPLGAHAVDLTVPSCAERFANFGETSNGFSFEEVASGIIALKTHGKLRSLSPDLIEDLMRLGKVSSKEELLQPEVQNQILNFITSKEKNWEEKFGKTAVALKSALQTSDQQKLGYKFMDINRGWGWQLLEDSDPAFHDPKYLAQSLKSTGASGTVMGLREATHARSTFDDAWRKAAPKNVLPPERFTLTGTDANNSLYDIAEQVIKMKKLNGPAEIITFNGSYAGVNGKISRIGKLGKKKDPNLIIESPHSPYWNPTDPKEIARLERLEAQALAAIRQKFSASAPAIGGFLLEPILGSEGVYFYRPEFLRSLRKLCDEFQVPIFADEILNGGGRTGKFFSYQHYEDFEPDFVTFGKGLQVAGVAKVKRAQAPNSFQYLNTHPDFVTLTHYEEPLNKGAQIMNRIADGKLEKNAEQNGKYFLEKLVAYANQRQINSLTKDIVHLNKLVEGEKAKLTKILEIDLQKRPDLAEYVAHWKNEGDSKLNNLFESIKKKEAELARILSDPNAKNDIRGMGMLMYAKNLPIPTAMGRLMPPLSMTRKEIDQFFIDIDKFYPYSR
jgi:acetylornithine/succinyldiaminopimelate/putrescine aminotransferase